MIRYIIRRDADWLYYDAIEDTFSHNATIFDNEMEVIRVYHELKRFHFVHVLQLEMKVILLVHLK